MLAYQYPADHQNFKCCGQDVEDHRGEKEANAFRAPIQRSCQPPRLP